MYPLDKIFVETEKFLFAHVQRRLFNLVTCGLSTEENNFICDESLALEAVL